MESNSWCKDFFAFRTSMSFCRFKKYRSDTPKYFSSRSEVSADIAGMGQRNRLSMGIYGIWSPRVARKIQEKIKKYAKKACNEIKSVLHSEIAEVHQRKTQ